MAYGIFRNWYHKSFEIDLCKIFGIKSAEMSQMKAVPICLSGKREITEEK